MASINGVSVKNIKKHKGWEGTFYSSSVYVDGVRVGEWSQSSTGGPCELYFASDKYNARVKAFNEGLQKKYTEPDNIMLYEICRLTEEERKFVNGKTHGYKSMSIISLGSSAVTLSSTLPMDKEEALQYIKANKLAEHYSVQPGDVLIFNTVDDFNFTIDSEHPAPHYYEPLDLSYELK